MNNGVLHFSRIITRSTFKSYIRSNLRSNSAAKLSFGNTLRRFQSAGSSAPQLASSLKMPANNHPKPDITFFQIPNDQPVVKLDCEAAFNNLNEKEKLYSHFISKASWYGGLIVLVQTSPESILAFELLRKLFSSQPISELKDVALKQSLSEDDFTALLVYTSGLFNNMGNYKGFGDTKFVPALEQTKLEKLVRKSKAYANEPTELEFILKNSIDSIYALDEKQRKLNFADQGRTTYFSKNCTEEDSKTVSSFLQSKKIDAYNTRCFKTNNEIGAVSYEVRLASALKQDDPEERGVLGDYVHENVNYHVTRGDYSPLMQLVVDNLTKAQEYALNETEKAMMVEYIKSFRTGSLPAHKDGSRHWVKDKGPIIESYIGFIETYRDPAGERGEFEGFVAMVNKEVSVKFNNLVANAEKFLPYLPWGAVFEKDTFLRPDFTSLEVLTFSGSGIPAGINIPNYDEIRQNEGFKNVSLGNVLTASYQEQHVTFLGQEDTDLMVKYRIPAFEVQVGLHELLGHGSGKLFRRNEDGTLNYPKCKNPITGEIISSHYEAGETYDNVFTTMGSSYEECRAECVGIVLCLKPDVMKVFGFEGKEADDVIYINWLNELLSGLKGLEMYQVETSSWGQAHSQARFAMLLVALEAGNKFVQIKKVEGADGKPDLLLTIDRSQIRTAGKEAFDQFLLKLQVYKSTADIKAAREMYAKYTAVDNGGVYPWLEYRDIVVDRRKPRKMFVQANTNITSDNTVELVTYEANHESLIQSFVDRYGEVENLGTTLVELWAKDECHF